MKKARADGTCYLPPEEIVNSDCIRLSNDGFSVNSKWEMIEEQETIDLTDELEVDGVKYRAPTTPREEFERTNCGGGGTSKYNFSIEIPRMKFKKKAQVPKTDRLGQLSKNSSTGEYQYVEKEIIKSVPNMDFIENHGLNYDSELYKWFDAFLPRKKTAQE